MLNKGYVYLIADFENQAFKIGKSKNNPIKRLKQLQTGNSSELVLLETFQTEYPYRLESILHNKYKHKQVHNEWFALTTDEVNQFQKTCEETNNIIHLMKDNVFFAKDLK